MQRRRTRIATLPLVVASCQTHEEDDRARIEMFDPAGAVETTVRHAPRLAGIDGATICALSDHMWEANRILPEIERVLGERYPSATFVSFDAFPDVYRADLDALGAAVTEAGCQGAVVASAG